MNIKKVLIGIAVVIIVLMVAAMLINVLFTDNGPELRETSSKTLVAPGVLYQYGMTKSGLFTAFGKSGQVVLSGYNERGEKQWQQKYNSERLLLDSSYKEIAVVDLGARQLRILSTDGEVQNSRPVSGTPLYLSISDDNRNLLVSETQSTNTGWSISLELWDSKGQELFTIHKDNMEIVNAIYSPLGVAVLAFSFDKDLPGQYLYVYDNYGKELYVKQFTGEINDWDWSPSGEYLLWSESGKLGLHNLSLDTDIVLAEDKIIGCGFSGESRVFLLTEKERFFPPGRETVLKEINYAGKTYIKNRYPGNLRNYYLNQDDALAVLTDEGVFISNRGIPYGQIPYRDGEQVLIDPFFRVLIRKDLTFGWYAK